MGLWYIRLVSLVCHFSVLYSESDHFPLDHHFSSTIGSMDTVVQIAVFLGIFVTVIVGASRNDGDFIMGLLNILLFYAFSSDGDNVLDLRHREILEEMPGEIRSVLSKFDFQSKTTIYAVCPNCHCTYAPIFDPGDSTPRYPSRCIHSSNAESAPCGAQLLSNSKDNKASQPIKPFVYHSFHDYLAGLLSRPDLETSMDKYCDDLNNSLGSPPPEIVSDVWEAQFLRTFDGPTKGTPFVARSGEDGRYAFVINVDFFNIEGMRIRGASTSCGLISLACLNLPPQIRYKPENMYVCIIPGPHQPSLVALNHYLRPLVDDMAESWAQGIRYSKTALHPEGRDTCSAIVVAAMDLPAARHVSGFASHSAHIYCTVCQCVHRTTLGRTDIERWLLRDDSIMKVHANQWKSANTTQEQDDIFKLHGTRYSEMWRLEYWSPSRQLSVDPMHCLVENQGPTHFRVVLGLTSASAATRNPYNPAFSYNFIKIDNEDNAPNGMTQKEARSVLSIHTLLTSPIKDAAGRLDHDDEEDYANLTDIAELNKRLMHKNTKPLQFVCEDLEVKPLARFENSSKTSKKDWVAALVEWVS